ncbi:uncharacterized protein LOC144139636 [Haemaphysalis longicornis]
MKDSSCSSTSTSSLSSEESERSFDERGKKGKTTATTSRRKAEASMSKCDYDLRSKLAATIAACKQELGKDFDVLFMSSSKRKASRGDTAGTGKRSAERTTSTKWLPIPCPTWIRRIARRPASSTDKRRKGCKEEKKVFQKTSSTAESPLADSERCSTKSESRGRHGDPAKNPHHRSTAPGCSRDAGHSGCTQAKDAKRREKTAKREMEAIRKAMADMEAELKQCQHFVEKLMKLAQGADDPTAATNHLTTTATFNSSGSSVHSGNEANPRVPTARAGFADTIVYAFQDN